MDFSIGLPNYEGKSVIMVVVHRSTKYAHLCALSHHFKERKVTNYLNGDSLKTTWYSKYYSKLQGSHF